MNSKQYFYRTAIFTRKNNQVALADINDPDEITALDDWLAVVVSLADGQHTIQELTNYMGRQYPKAPANLVKTLGSVIERLQEGKIIKLSDQPVELPYYLTSPVEELDIDKAKKLIKEDGYAQH